jgi:hypothetical protein
MASVRGRLTQAQQAEAAKVAGSGPPGPWASHAPRRAAQSAPRGSLAGPGPETARAQRALLPTGGSQGNAGLIRGAPSQGRPYSSSRFSGSQYPAAEPGEATSRGYGTKSRTGGAFADPHGSVRYDRHMMSKTGTEMQQAHPDSPGGQGLAPLADGPVMPGYVAVSRAMARRHGNTGTRHLDNPGPFAAVTDSEGRRQPLGTQDGSPYTGKYGGTPGLTHVYGRRGTAGVISPAQPGGPGDGHQLIRGGPPHGLHSRVQPTAQARAGRYSATPQQRRTRRSLPADSARAGQAWSQNAQVLGRAATPVPKVSGRLPGNTGGRLKRR